MKGHRPLSGLFFLVVLLVGVDIPDGILVRAPGQHRLHRMEGGQHRMVLVVVLVESVATHGIQVGDRRHEGAHLVNVGVGTGIGRIRLGASYHRAVQVSFGRQDPYLLQLFEDQLDQILVIHVPQLVGLVTEILRTDPDTIAGDHIGAPVVEDLHPAHLHTLVLDVDPIVADELPVLVLELEFGEFQADDQEIPVLQALKDLVHLGGNGRPHGLRHILQGHGAEYGVAIDRGQDIVLAVLDVIDTSIFQRQPRHFRLQGDPDAGLRAFIGHLLPQHARTLGGIQELLDERGGCTLGIPVTDAHHLLEAVPDEIRDLERLDALAAPFGADLGTGLAPDLPRVVLEEHIIDLAAETVDVEILQVLLGPYRRDPGKHQVAGDAQGPFLAQVEEQTHADLQRVIVHPIFEVDARLPRADEHGVMRAPPQQSVDLLLAVVVAYLAVVLRGVQDRQELGPPLEYPVGLGEEPMTADVDKVALVVNRPADTAHLYVRLQHKDIECAGAGQLVGRREAGRSCAYDYNFLPITHLWR